MNIRDVETKTRVKCTAFLGVGMLVSGLIAASVGSMDGNPYMGFVVLFTMLCVALGILAALSIGWIFDCYLD